MRTTIFHLNETDEVAFEQVEQPDWKPFTEWEGEPLDGVELVEVVEHPRASLQLVKIRAGGHFVMHATPDIAHCQIMTGEGILGMPGGRELHYSAPELYVFKPDTLHEWRDITEDTLLSVCIVRLGENLS